MFKTSEETSFIHKERKRLSTELVNLQNGSEVFYQMQDSAEMLRESKAKLFTYTGEPICVVGCMYADVRHN